MSSPRITTITPSHHLHPQRPPQLQHHLTIAGANITSPPPELAAPSSPSPPTTLHPKPHLNESETQIQPLNKATGSGTVFVTTPQSADKE
ncbi:hypothetical protein P8452_15451 [Trifolium repens]|nr:hypothetical protein QL285_055401 [Trifolium repens]WJX26542.1 hypothetical protein P8452_15451 [Trifolium repens]